MARDQQDEIAEEDLKELGLDVEWAVSDLTRKLYRANLIDSSATERRMRGEEDEDEEDEEEFSDDDEEYEEFEELVSTDCSGNLNKESRLITFAIHRKLTKMIKHFSMPMSLKVNYNQVELSQISSWRRLVKQKMVEKARNLVSWTMNSSAKRDWPNLRFSFSTEVRSEPPPGFNPKVVEVYTKYVRIEQRSWNENRNWSWLFGF